MSYVPPKGDEPSQAEELQRPSISPALPVKSAKERFNPFEKNTLVVAILGLVVTAITMLFIGLQWNEMHSGASDTHDLAVAAKAQADAAKAQAGNTHDLAEYAKQQADNTKAEVEKLDKSIGEAHALAVAARAANENSVKADRPWIGTIGVVTEPIQADKEGKIDVVILNTGKTPARIISFRAANGYYATFPENPVYATPSKLPEISQTILVPNVQSTDEFTYPPIPEQLFKLIKDRTIKFYVYSLVVYEDLRIKGVRHETKTCFFWTDRPGPVAFATCPEYNDAN